MTIRAKLYAAIVLTILGPLATTAVALHGMSQMGDRFDEVRERAAHEQLAREIKFAVTDMNGWQTAYGYAGGDFRDRFNASAAKLRADLEAGDQTFGDAQERPMFEQLQRNVDRFMALDAVAWRSLRAGDPARTKRILLGPELVRFEAMAQAADQLADYQDEQAAATQDAFDDARDDARRRLIAVALGAAVVVVLLLVTANDIARMALEGERRVRGRKEPEPESDEAS
jgi:hypothetical protein